MAFPSRFSSPLGLAISNLDLDLNFDFVLRRTSILRHRLAPDRAIVIQTIAMESTSERGWAAVASRLLGSGQLDLTFPHQ